MTGQSLLGGWSQRGDAGFFEEFSLESAAGGRVFNSWLHQRPDISGASWTLQDCQLVIKTQDDGLGPFRFRILGLKQGVLRLYDVTDRVESAYTRVPADP